jgi:hypothetical protein
LCSRPQIAEKEVLAAREAARQRELDLIMERERVKAVLELEVPGRVAHMSRFFVYLVFFFASHHATTEANSTCSTLFGMQNRTLNACWQPHASFQ